MKNEQSPPEKLHPQKQFDRYVGNIAESDEDYNEEDESGSD